MRTTVDNRRTSPWPWIALGVLCLTAIYLLRDDPTPQAGAVIAPEPPPAQTVVVEVNAVLSIPTATVTPIPTLYPTAAATVDPTLNDCDRVTPKAGTECRMPPAPTPTEVPRPECPTEPSKWCVWPDADETSGEAATR